MALSEEERQVFDQAADLAATGQDASPYLTDKLVAIIDRLEAAEARQVGEGEVIVPGIGRCELVGANRGAPFVDRGFYRIRLIPTEV